MNLIAKTYSNLPIEAREIRETVFVIEQGFVDEFDEDDNKAIHIVLFNEELPIATSRIIYSEKHHCYTIGRFAVIKEYRNKQIGRKLMEITEQEIINRFGHIQIGVSAQKRAEQFYEKMGYKYTNKRYLDQNYPHVWMTKQL